MITTVSQHSTHVTKDFFFRHIRSGLIYELVVKELVVKC